MDIPTNSLLMSNDVSFFPQLAFQSYYPRCFPVLVSILEAKSSPFQSDLVLLLNNTNNLSGSPILLQDFPEQSHKASMSSACPLMAGEMVEMRKVVARGRLWRSSQEVQVHSLLLMQE